MSNVKILSYLESDISDGIIKEADSTENKVAIMVDIETLSTAKNAKIISIGAVAIDLGETRKIIGRFSINVSSNTPQYMDFAEDDDTKAWWKSDQLEGARKCLEGPTHSISQSLKEFADWMSNFEIDSLWSKGITFDAIILENAFAVCEIEWPIRFWQLCCLRSLCHFEKLNIPRFGVAHCALDDAMHEAFQYINFYENCLKSK